MAISEIPKIKDENFDKLNVAEDSKLILSLLNEYSEKLLKVCDQYEQTMNSLYLITYTILFGSAGLLFLSVTYNYIVYLQTRNIYGSAIPYFSLSFITSFVNYLVLRGIRYQRQLNILKNSRRIAIRLERIINIASQFNEQVATNFASRIEFDFRLTDAEEVLELYRYLSLKHRKSIRIFN